MSASNAVQPLPTVPKVELPRYAGKWNEVARLPFFFQHGCTHSTAEYKLKPDGTVSVINRCLKSERPKQVQGNATVVDKKTNAVLEVRFNEWYSVFIPRSRQGNYFIIWLAPDYSAAAVGTPSRKCLWILARQPNIPAATFHEIVQHCSKLGFPIEKLIVENAQAH